MGQPATHALSGAAPDIAPYLPRVVLEWLADTPTSRHRSLDGTMVFVDISGFTALSERLAPAGRLGAEEVTDVMNETFSRLLGVSYESGGSLLKLGGDAMLLFFEGDDHGRRGCAAAWRMRASLESLGALPSSVGPVQLQMHVGIHSGRFDFFLVGERHRELIVAASGAADTVAMEEVAQAGEIALSPATAALLDPGDLQPGDGRATLLAALPAAAPPPPSPLPDLAGQELLQGIPESLRSSVLAQTVESEHRRAVVAFVRFSGVDELRIREGVEAACAAVEEVVTVLQAAAASHGATFLETDIDAAGGRAVLVAGVPTTNGDDEERLLRTVRAAVDADTRLPLHVGIAAGNVFAGVVGPPYRRAYTILGGTAALAARLMARAESGAIYATPDLLERSSARFAFTSVGSLSLKGKSTPVEVVSVGAIAAARRAPARRKLALVDRQRELPMLDAMLVPVSMGFGNFLELVGDPGVGKSRIVEELCDRASDLRLVSTSCEQYEATTPYFPFRKLMRGLLEIGPDPEIDRLTAGLTDRLLAVDDELVPWLPLIADVLDLAVHPTRATDELQPSFRRARLHGVVETLLTQLLDTPTLLLFEDSHWMDEASADLLRHLGSRVTTKPWLVCSTRRTSGGGFVAAHGTPPVAAFSLRLEPLPEADARALATAAADGDLSREELAAITERAGGNPLFVQELVASRGGVEALPESVEGVVTSRIDSLAPADRAVLRWASVLGASFTSGLVADVLDDDADAALDAESWDRLAEFVERDPYVADTFRFRHALIRDAAYEGLSFRRRRELHARVGEVLRDTSRDGDEVAEALSLHFSLADRPADTWRYSLVAAKRAQAKFANVDAAEFYRRALDAARELPSLQRGDVAAVWEALGDVLERTGAYADAHLAYKQARTLARGDHRAITRLCLKEGRLSESEGKYAAALGWFTRGLHAADSSDDPLAADRLRLELGYAATRFRQGDVHDCIARCTAAIPAAQAAGERAELAHAYYLLHLAYASIGSPLRIDVRELALPIYEELGDLLGQANALNHLGIDAYYEGRWKEALEYYDRGLRARERIGDVVGGATMKNNIAEVYSDQGHLEEAEQLFRDALQTYDAAGSSAYSAVVKANLGRAAARAGRLEEGRELLTTALHSLLELEAWSFVAETHVRLAELAVLAGDPDGALAASRAAGELVYSTTSSVQALQHRVHAYAHAQLGDLVEAERALERSLEIAEATAALYEVALSLRARARLRDDKTLTEEAATMLRVLDVVSVADPPLHSGAC